MMKKKFCAVLIPIYKRNPDDGECVAIKRIGRVLEQVPIYYVAPEGLAIDVYKSLIPHAEVEYFSTHFFEGFAGYNQLMLSEMFYMRFLKYKKILICQPDVFVFENRLEEFADMPYDYIGAPIVKYGPWEAGLIVGNGGFSIRNVKAHLCMVKKSEIGSQKNKLNEDIFFLKCGEWYPDEFKVAPLDVAINFAFDQSVASACYSLSGYNVPFGFHGWNRGDITLSKQLISPLLEQRYVWPEYEKKEETINRIKDFISGKSQVYFWGAGDVGKMLYVLCQKYKLDFEGYIVSDDQEIEDRVSNGKRVCYLGEINITKDIGVVITISRRYRNSVEIEKKLLKKGIEDIFDITQTVLWALEEELCTVDMP